MAYGDVYRRFKEAPRTMVMEDTDNVKVLCTILEGVEYRFNCEWMTDQDLDWFAPIFEKHLVSAYKLGEQRAKRSISSAYNSFLQSMR